MSISSPQFFMKNGALAVVGTASFRSFPYAGGICRRRRATGARSA